MSEKKVGVSPRAHAAATEYCKTRDLRMKTWLSRLILRETGAPEKHHKKILETLSDRSDPRVWSKPPFWAKP